MTMDKRNTNASISLSHDFPITLITMILFGDYKFKT